MKTEADIRRRLKLNQKALVAAQRGDYTVPESPTNSADILTRYSITKCKVAIAELKWILSNSDSDLG